MSIKAFFLVIISGLAGLNPGLAQDAVVLNYQGRVQVQGSPFSGTGYFMFSLEGANGEIFWASGDFPFAGSTNLPANALRLSAQGGAYTVRLGQAGTGMPPLAMAGLLRLSHPRLKVWFNDSRHGWQRAGDDVPLDPLLASLAENGKRPLTGNQTDAILQELRELRIALTQPNRGAAPAPAPEPPAYGTVTLAGPAMGRADAPVVLVEFTDYQCPFCKKFHDTIMPELVRQFVDAGKLRIVSRNLPLPFHPNAGPAALAAACANQQDKYWLMREKLFAHSSELTSANSLVAATAATLDLPKFQACLEARLFDAALKKDSQEAEAVGISGTPSFVVGKPEGDHVRGLIIVGTQPVNIFAAEIQKLLAVK